MFLMFTVYFKLFIIDLHVSFLCYFIIYFQFQFLCLCDFTMVVWSFALFLLYYSVFFIILFVYSGLVYLFYKLPLFIYLNFTSH